MTKKSKKINKKIFRKRKGGGCTQKNAHFAVGEEACKKHGCIWTDVYLKYPSQSKFKPWWHCEQPLTPQEEEKMKRKDKTWKKYKCTNYLGTKKGCPKKFCTLYFERCINKWAGGGVSEDKELKMRKHSRKRGRRRRSRKRKLP